QTSGSSISILLAVATIFTGSGNLYCQWELLTWQWECLVHFIPNRYGAQANSAAPGIRSIWNSIGRAGGRRGKSSRNTSRKSQTIDTSLSCFPSDLSSSFLADICARKI
nr:hypothetical protein [Tanacetum cinerariifolium]